MAHTELRDWERCTRSLWSEGHTTQQLSWTRFTDDKKNTLICKIEQDNPRAPARVTATISPRYVAPDNQPVPAQKWISSGELNEFKGLYRTLPGTPDDVKFVEVL